MKNLIFLVTLVLSPLAQANVVDTCQLGALDDDMNIEGSFIVSRSTAGLVMDAKVKVSQEVEEHSFDASDKVAKVENVVGDAIMDLANKDDLVYALVQRLGSEKPVDLKSYQGDGFSEDGNGLVLVRVTGEKGTVLGIAMIGWGAASCD